MEIGRSELAKLISAKATVNTSLRWLPFFLPTLAVAFDSSTATLALLLGVAEASGLSTFFVGRWLDAGRERLVIISSLIGVVASSLLALVGSIWTLAAALLLLGVASAHITVAGQTWISVRAPFGQRARYIGIYEISWALALLVGAPSVALLISIFGWRGPFVAIAVAAVMAAVLIAAIDDGEHAIRQKVAPPANVPITRETWLIISASAALAMSALGTSVIAGTWLDEVLGVSTGGVGLVAMAIGLAELIASTGSSAFADRLGKHRTMKFSVAATLIGLTMIVSAGTSIFLGALGLFVFFVCFEYSIVTSFSLVSESMPKAPGRALAVSNATGTVGRGIGVSAAGLLYEAFGIRGPVVFSATGALITFVLLIAFGRLRPDFA